MIVLSPQMADWVDLVARQDRAEARRWVELDRVLPGALALLERCGLGEGHR